MESCPYCTGVAKLYQETWHTRLYIDKLGRRYILKTETCYCPLTRIAAPRTIRATRHLKSTSALIAEGI